MVFFIPYIHHMLCHHWEALGALKGVSDTSAAFNCSAITAVPLGDTISRADIAIVGAGAAGIATAIFARRANPARSVALLDGATQLGAKILVSGGGRCNVTNREVSEGDFWGGRRSIIRRILKAFTADEAAAFFRELGVPLQEEADGKLFPVSGRARDVLNALLRCAEAAGVQLLPGRRVLGVERSADGFRLAISGGDMQCSAVVLATGGHSLPKTGSDGAGMEFARTLGHTIVPTTPALVPLVLDAAHKASIHHDLSGVSHDVELAVWVDGRISTRLSGALLWTHFGISGPVALNASRHYLRAEIEGRPVRLTANFCPEMTFESCRPGGRQRRRRVRKRPSQARLQGACPQQLQPPWFNVSRSIRRVSWRISRAPSESPSRARSSNGRCRSQHLVATTTRRPQLVASCSTRSIRRRWRRGSVPDFFLLARCSTSTAGSADSIFNGRGRLRISRDVRWAEPRKRAVLRGVAFA